MSIEIAWTHTGHEAGQYGNHSPRMSANLSQVTPTAEKPYECPSLDVVMSYPTIAIEMPTTPTTTMNIVTFLLPPYKARVLRSWMTASYHGFVLQDIDSTYSPLSIVSTILRADDTAESACN